MTQVDDLRRTARRDEPGSGPAVVACETLAEYAVAVAAAVAGGSETPAWVPVLRPPGSRLPQLVLADGDAAARVEAVRGELRGDACAPARDRWRRWSTEAPGVDPLRWYLAAASPAAASEESASFVTALSTMGPVERLERLTALAGLTSSESAVAGWGDPGWALPAMLQAALTRRPFLWLDDRDELLELAGHVQRLSVVASARDLDLDRLARLAEAAGFHLPLEGLQHVTFSRASVSFTTGRTLEIATRVVAKQLAYRRRELRQTAWVVTEDLPGRIEDPEVVSIPREDASVDRIRRLGDVDLLLLWGHSREDLFHLGRDALCGLSHEADGADPEERLPACMHDGRCVKDGELLRVAELPAKALVVGGCNIVRLGPHGTFAPEFSLALSALEGAANLVVASPRNHSGFPVEQLLLYRLLRAGARVGEAVRIVNNSLPFLGRESPDYVILGDGEWRLFPREEPRAETAVLPGDAGWRVECRDVRGHYLEVRLPSTPREPFVRLDEASGPDAERDLLYAVSPEADGTCRVFVYGLRPLEAARLVFTVDSRRPGGSVEAALASAYRNWHAYGRLLKSYVPKLAHQEQELRSLGTALVRKRDEAAHRLAASPKAERTAADAEALLARMDESLCRYFLDRISVRAFVWHDQCLDVDGSFYVAEHCPRDRRCPYCEGSIVRRIIRHRFEAEISRELAQCETCGTVWDVPSGGVDPVFHGPALLERGRRHGYAVSLRNDLDRTIEGRLGFRMRQAERHGTVVEPSLLAVRLEPGEREECQFSIAVGASMPAHMEVVRGFWVSELGVSVFQRNVWITPETT